MNRLILWAAAAVVAAAAPAQSLLRDVNPDTVNPGSSPGYFVRSGNYAFFRQLQGAFELWRTDGTAAGTIPLQLPAAGNWRDAPALELVDLDGAGTIILSVSDAAGSEPWAARANPPSLTRLADIMPGLSGSRPSGFLRVGRVVLFSATTMTGLELWRTDGTPAGTQRVMGGGYSRALATVSGIGMFDADGMLLASDGTAAGTVRLAGTPMLFAFAVVGNRMFFVGTDALNGDELWVTDGSVQGTRLVADLVPGPVGSRITALGAFGSGVLIGRTGELWRSDGTAAGTVRVANPVTWVTAPQQITQLGGLAYFTAAEIATGSELWVTDGSAAGTRLFADLVPGVVSSSPSLVFAGSNELLFVALDVGTSTFPVHRVRADGTREQLALRADRALAIAFGAQVLLAGGAGRPTEFEPVLLNGPTHRVLRDIVPPQAASSRPANFAVGDGMAYFTADGGNAVGTELWQTDGTSAGTTIVADLTQGPGHSDIMLPIATDRGLFFFHRRLGTNAAPQWMVADRTGVRVLLNLADTLPFTVAPAPRGTGVVAGLARSASAPTAPALLISDGTSTGTVALNSSLTLAMQAVRAGETVFFVGFDQTDTELWATDGTPSNTRRVIDLTPGGRSEIMEMTPFGQRVVFAVSHAPNQGLYVSDGTAPGTTQIIAGAITQIAAAGERVFFARDEELWSSDGTVAGTVRVGALGVARIADLVGAGRTVYLVVETGQSVELWATEGSLASLRAVHAQAVPAMYHGFVGTAGGDLLFAVGERALWLTDGTVAGTRMLHDRVSGYVPAVKFRRGLLLAAEDGAHGVELWRAGFAELGVSDAIVFGRGCPGSNGEPALTAQSAPHVGSLSYPIQLARARASTVGAIWLSGERVRFDLPGDCAVYVPPTISLPVQTDVFGTATLHLRIPLEQTLIGAGLFVQGLVVDPQGAFAGVLAMSQGLELVIGR